MQNAITRTSSSLPPRWESSLVHLHYIKMMMVSIPIMVLTNLPVNFIRVCCVFDGCRIANIVLMISIIIIIYHFLSLSLFFKCHHHHNCDHHHHNHHHPIHHYSIHHHHHIHRHDHDHHHHPVDYVAHMFCVRAVSIWQLCLPLISSWSS